MILKLDMQYRVLEIYKVYINDELVLTLTYFTTKSYSATYAFEWEKLLQIHLKGKRQMTKLTEDLCF